MMLMRIEWYSAKVDIISHPQKGFTTNNKIKLEDSIYI